MRPFYVVLLMLDVLYCVVALGNDKLPGWKMFAAVDRVDFELRDRDGLVVDLRDWLPRGANVTESADLVRVAEFVCKKQRSRAPFTLAVPARGAHVEINPECAADAPR